MLALVLSLSLFTNCKKDEKEPEPAPTPAPPPPTNTQKLTGKNWKLTALTIDPAIMGITDLYAQMEDCEKDNIWRFESGGQFKYDEGATKCSSTDPQSETGTWVWNTNETVITVSDGTDNVSYNVVTNDGNTLKVTNTSSEGGVNMTITMTFTKQ